MSSKRIVSFLPSATELLFELGAWILKISLSKLDTHPLILRGFVTTTRMA
jgi:hypothetical protein